MLFQIDERLARFSGNLWRLSYSRIDHTILQPIVDANGNIVEISTPHLRPETELERFETINWSSARPSRWLTADQLNSRVQVSNDGKLIGVIGFFFTPETTTEMQRAGERNASQ